MVRALPQVSIRKLTKSTSDDFMKSRGWRKERIEMFQNALEARKFVKFNTLLEKQSRPLFEVGFTVKKLWGKYFVTVWMRR